MIQEETKQMLANMSQEEIEYLIETAEFARNNVSKEAEEVKKRTVNVERIVINGSNLITTFDDTLIVHVNGFSMGEEEELAQRDPFHDDLPDVYMKCIELQSEHGHFDPTRIYFNPYDDRWVVEVQTDYCNFGGHVYSEDYFETYVGRKPFNEEYIWIRTKEQYGQYRMNDDAVRLITDHGDIIEGRG